MKGSATIDYDAKTVRIDLTLEALEEGGPAIDAIKGACRVLWPDIYFSGLDDPPEEAEGGCDSNAQPPAPAALISAPAEPPTPGRPPKSPRRPMTFSSAPPEGSFDARVLEATKRIGSTDRGALAEAVDANERVVAMALTRLRRGGALSAAGF